MQEQGYTQAECSSEECAAEIGALLGVQFMISGAIGKLEKLIRLMPRCLRYQLEQLKKLSVRPILVQLMA